MSNMISPYRHQAMSALDHLYVVTTVFNPMRYKSRYELYWQFKRHMQDLGAKLVTVELAFGDRPFEVTTGEDPLEIQLRVDDRQEFWLKESALNVGISRLPVDAKFVMWADADIRFVRPDILEEVVHQLQHYDVVQCFEDALDLGPRGEVIEAHKGFVWSWLQGLTSSGFSGGGQSYYPRRPVVATKFPGAILHSGYCWAARVSAIEHLGGLLDTGLCGASDHHMAFSLIEEGVLSLPPGLSSGYIRHVAQWQERAHIHIRQNIGYVPGTIVHSFHGKKVNRRYAERWQIITDHQFDPDLDLKRALNGLLMLTHRGLRMRKDLRRYMLERNEDDVVS